jgi:glycosyltransferase involved in cell wall biosynthesis
MRSPAPTVTVVMATFNRSNIIRYAIDSVRRQTWGDWELLVVGDACTDDTAAAVSAFEDPRIRFRNLPERCGEQSGPTNRACVEARGRIIALLNHDDLWAPEHLARAVSALDDDPALDLVYGLNIAVQPDGTYRLRGPSPSGWYEEHAGIPASAWVFRRALSERVGPWRAARDLYNHPSQDWLRRAQRVGARMRLLPHLSVVSLPSGNRPRSYAERLDTEHAEWSARMTASADWQATLLCDVVRQLDLSSYRSANSLAVRAFLWRACKNAVRRVLHTAGMSANAAAFAVRYRRRGGCVDHLRRVRGLDPLPREGKR